MKPVRLAQAVQDDSGVTALVVAVMIVVLLGLGAFFIDTGALFSERRSLQGAADAGALAGVQELPGNTAAAVAASNGYATRNAVGLGVAAPVVTSEVRGNDTVVCVVRDPERELMFARFLGHETARVGARAVAKVQSPVAYGRGVMPFGIMSAEPSGTSPFGYPFGATVTLKQPGGKGESGNFQFLALTDPPGGKGDANDITGPKGALANGGDPDPVYVNRLYYPKTGVNGIQVSSSLNSWIAGDTCRFQDVARLEDDGYVTLLDEDCHRLIVCPIIVDPGPPVVYNWTEMQGTSDKALVIGFAYFFIEDVGTSGKECYVTGRFVKPISPKDDVMTWGAIDPYGAIAYRLAE